jgi:ketosteroid isomerase-like protein
MKALSSLCLLAIAYAALAPALNSAQEPTKPTGEQLRIIALESAWDQAEQSKDSNALSALLADNLVYVDYDGTLYTKQTFLASVKSSDITSEQILNEGVTVRLYNNNSIAVSTGIYRDKGLENGKPFVHRGRFINVWLNQNGSWQCISSQSTLIVPRVPL